MKHRTEIVQIVSERYLKTGSENVGPNKIHHELVEKINFLKKISKNIA